MTDSSSFFRAAESGDVEHVRRHLAADPSLVNARDSEGATALHHAAFNGHREIVELLCDRGSDINARDDRHHATPSGWAIEYLRERGGLLAIEIEDALFAIRTRDVAWARRLITRHPALTTATDRHGKPLAAYARECGDPAIGDLFAP